MMKIVYLASHARAGETVVLRALSCHPRIHVPLQVTQDEDPQALRFVSELRANECPEIRPDHWYAQAMKLRPDTVILVKQGVWEQRGKFDGIVLIRNPLSFVHSMLEYNQREGLRLAIRERRRYEKNL